MRTRMGISGPTTLRDPPRAPSPGRRPAALERERGPRSRGPLKMRKPWRVLCQGCGRFFLGGGTEALLANRELLLREGKSALELGDARLQGVQLPRDHVRGRLAYVAHERLRHPEGPPLSSDRSGAALRYRPGR